MDLLGLRGKPVVLHFWGARCPPYRANMPALQQFHDQWGDRIVVLAIDVGPEVGLGTREDAKAILEEMGITYPAGFTDDPQILTRYQVIAMPTTIFIAASGQVFDRWAGLINLDILNRIAESMIKEPRVMRTPTPTHFPTLTPVPVQDCRGFELEREILLRLAPRLGPDPATGSLGGTFECRPDGVSVGLASAARHSNSFSITRYDTEEQARTGLGREGAANSTFRDSPAVHVSKTGSPMPQSLQESLAWQKSRWVFKATSFDDTHFRIALNVFRASERMYDAASELGLFSGGGPFPTTPTPKPTPNCGYSFAYLDHPELSRSIEARLDSSGQEVTSVFSQAYGEDYFCDRKVVSFGAMETAIKVTLDTDALPDIQRLGALMSSVLGTLPTSYDPKFGPRFIIVFVAGDEEAKADFSIHTLAEVRDKQLQGSVLLAALGYEPTPQPPPTPTPTPTPTPPPVPLSVTINLTTTAEPGSQVYDVSLKVLQSDQTPGRFFRACTDETRSFAFVSAAAIEGFPIQFRFSKHGDSTRVSVAPTNLERPTVIRGDSTAVKILDDAFTFGNVSVDGGFRGISFLNAQGTFNDTDGDGETDALELADILGRAIAVAGDVVDQCDFRAVGRGGLDVTPPTVFFGAGCGAGPVPCWPTPL